MIAADHKYVVVCPKRPEFSTMCKISPMQEFDMTIESFKEILVQQLKKWHLGYKNHTMITDIRMKNGHQFDPKNQLDYYRCCQPFYFDYKEY